MSVPTELAALYRRDLMRLLQDVSAFPDDDSLWRKPSAIPNSAGNLALHLEGNLREFIGRQLGNQPYQRQRDLEFSADGIPQGELIQRIGELKDLISNTIAGLSPEQWEATYPQNVFGAPISTGQLLMSLYGHLNYHLGQIDYLRRILTGGKGIDFAGL